MINSASLGCDIVIRGRNEDGSRYEKTVNYKPYFYVENPSGQYTSLFGKKLEKKEFQNVGKLVAARKYFDDTYESDVLHANRYLIDNVKEIPKEPVRICYLDIETEDREGFPDPEVADKRILSIALYDSFTQKYTILYNSPNFIETNYRKELTIENEKIIVNHIECKHEVDLLEKFIGVFDALDFDVIYAWNGDGFDYPYIVNRLTSMDLNPNKLSPIKKFDKYKKLPQCRAWLDLMRAHRKLSTQEMESYSLEYISKMELGYGKMEHEERIGDLWQYDLYRFIEYNVRDVFLMVKIDTKKGITEYFDTIRRMTFCNWADVYWNSRVLDFFSLKKAHDMGIVLPSTKHTETSPIQGARVLTPLVGIHENAAVLDFSALYPSAILTLNLSPETFIDKNYAEINNIETTSIDGLHFRLDKRGFIPLMIEELMELRKEYKSEMKKHKIGSDEYNVLDTTQTVCKFLTNSLYGVMLFPHFRLFKREVGSATTSFGRQANIWIENIVKEKGYTPVYGDSVVKGTKVDIVGRGRIKIEDLFTKVDYTKGDKEYCLLDNIYTPTIDDDGFCVNKRVPYIMRHKTDKQIYRVWWHKYNYLDLTEDHSLIGFKVRSEYYKYNIKNRFIKLKPQDIFKNNITLIQQKCFDNIEIDDDIPVEVYEYIGLHFGDGSFDIYPSGKLAKWVRLATGNDQEEIIKKYIEPLKNIGWIDKVKIYEDRIKIYGKISEYLKKHHYSGYKRVKKFDLDFLKNKPKHKKCAVIRGMMDSDGHIYSRNEKYFTIAFTNTEIEFCYQLQQLLKECGVCSTVYLRTRKPDKRTNKIYKETADVVIKSRFDYKNNIGFKIERKFEKMNNILNNGFIHVNDIVETRPIKIEPINYNDYVYDIEVVDTHRFFANNILVSNTDSVCIKKENLTLDEMIEQAKEITSYINSKTNEWCENNWKTSKYNKMKIEFELVYSKLITLVGKQNEASRKRYSGLVAYKDGVDLRNEPELKFMGINAKRSDTPKVFRDLQKRVFKMVLEDKHEEAKKLLKETRLKITNGEFSPEEISIPKGLSKNIDEYDKTLPIHVRAAKYANEYLGENIKREKIKYCYVKRCPPDKPQTNVVAFTEKFPEGFEPDWIKMSERVVDFIYDTLFRTLGWNINELKGQVTLAAFM